MRIIANSETYEVADGLTLEEFVRDRSLALERVVVERNGEALTPTEARATVLAEGDRLEIVRIVAGG
jgi:sulfur carrier protein